MEREAAENDRMGEVQVFDVSEGLKKRKEQLGRVDMAKSPNSFVALFLTPPRGGETHIHQHPDSDQILFILKGELTVEGDIGRSSLKANQGVLIPAGAFYGFTNTGKEDVIFLSMRTESVGGRRSAHVPNVPSKLCVKIPADQISAKGFGSKLYAYAMTRSTIGLSVMRLEEWNKASLLRLDCDFEKSDGYILAKLPERLVKWYELESLSESDYKLISEPDKARVRVALTEH